MTRPGPLLLAETGLALVRARLALKSRSFEQVVTRLHAQEGKESIGRAEALMLERALRAWERRVPFRALCFEQGLAAMDYLRRRGLAATLHYGARGTGDAIEAHVWVMSGTVPVVGWRNAEGYRELQRYPRH